MATLCQFSMLSNKPAQPQKLAKGSKFWMLKVEKLSRQGKTVVLIRLLRNIIFLKTMLILALGAPLAQLVEYRTLGHNVAGLNLTRGAVKCVLEQDCDLSPLLSTGSTQENIPT